VCICGAPAAARAESEDDPVWIDEVWPGLAAQLDQVVQAHAAGDGLAPREVQGKSNSTADLLRRCRGNGNAAGLADRLGSVRVCCSADLSGTWSYQVQQSRPFSARGSLGQRQIQSVEQFFSSPISNSSALWSWRRESRIVRVEGRRAYNDPERQLVRCRPNCRQTNPHSDRHQRPSTRCRRHTCPHPKQRFCPDTEEVTGSNPVSPTSNIPNQPPVCDRGHAGGAEIG
jgi:hypothetical protein